MTGHPFLARLARLARGLAALLFVVALLVGPPLLLWRYIGWPLPDHLPAWDELKVWLTSPLTDQTLINTLACVVWFLWASLAVSIASEAIAAARGVTVPRLPAVAPLQAFAAALIGAIALGLLPGASARAGARDGMLDATLAAHATDTAVSAPAQPGQLATTPDVGDQDPPRTDDRPQVRTVERGDTLWDIAEDEYGDGTRYRRIYEANQGRPQPHGLPAITDPDLIYPGQRLRIPGQSTDGAPPPAGDGTPRDHPSADPTPTVQATPSIPGTATPTPPDPTPTQPSPAAPGAPGPDDAEHPDEQRHPPPAVLELPSGALIGVSVAAAVSAALLVLRLRSRRTYQPQPPAPGRRLDPPRLSATARALLAARRRTRRGDTDQPPAEPAAPTRQATENPTLIELGVHNGDTVCLDLLEAGGLAVEGPGADAAVRALLVSLARHVSHQAEIVTPATTRERLLPGADEVPGLRVVGDLDAATTELEVETVARTRHLADLDAADYPAHRRDHPEDPLPLLVLTADVAPAAVPRLAAILTLGPRLGITGLLLGEAPAGLPQLHVDPDGRVTHAEPDTFTGTRIVGLSATEAADILRVFAARRTDQPIAAEPATEPDTAPDTAPGTAAHDPASEHPIATIEAPAESWPTPPARAEPRHAPVHVRVLGPVRVTAWDEEIKTGLRETARELLAYYLLRPDGATAEAAIDALWPDTDLERGRKHFWNALGNLRAKMRGPAGSPKIDVLTKHGDHYRPQAEFLHVDLWDFEQALTEARDTGNAEAEATALHRALDLYRGDYAQGGDYVWVAPAREDLNRRAFNAAARLADLHASANRPQQAIACLEHATRLDPYAEGIYRRLISLHLQRGDTDTARRLHRELVDRLADLDLDPEPETTALISEATGRRPSRKR